MLTNFEYFTESMVLVRLGWIAISIIIIIKDVHSLKVVPPSKMSVELGDSDSIFTGIAQNLICTFYEKHCD